jgi:hypothetical protein
MQVLGLLGQPLTALLQALLLEHVLDQLRTMPSSVRDSLGWAMWKVAQPSALSLLLTCSWVVTSWVGRSEGAMPSIQQAYSFFLGGILSSTCIVDTQQDEEGCRKLFRTQWGLAFAGRRHCGRSDVQMCLKYIYTFMSMLHSLLQRFMGAILPRCRPAGTTKMSMPAKTSILRSTINQSYSWKLNVAPAMAQCAALPTKTAPYL